MPAEDSQHHVLGLMEKQKQTIGSKLLPRWALCTMKAKNYIVLPSDDEIGGADPRISVGSQEARITGMLAIVSILSTISTIIVIIVALNVGPIIAWIDQYRQQLPASCSNPGIRREWRMLRDDEKMSYIQAVMCLTKIPSILTTEGSLYDDHALAHMLVGSHCTRNLIMFFGCVFLLSDYANILEAHLVASFFPWHRMFLHIFELNLKTKCGYQDALPYWDWSLDWEDIASAPVWDNTYGFGGDGDPNVPNTLRDGSHCVTDGPFNRTWLQYRNGTSDPHCLSRGFSHYEKKEFGSISGFLVQPARMSELASQPNFDTFRNFTELVVHNAIHWGIRGDFGQWSAANDPIFYLHHAQLDRLWWIWQKEMPSRRLEYYGQAFVGSAQAASLNDHLNSIGLFRSVSVSEVMNIEDGILCYQY